MKATSFLKGLKAPLLALLVMAVVSGCGLFSNAGEDPTKGWSAAKLYAEAHDNLLSNDWAEAIKMYDILQARYPFGRYAQQAQMETAYAQWKTGDDELALSTAERFIKQYPNHPKVDYMYYLRGLISFHDDLGLLSFISNEDLTERDPKSLRESFDAFRELVNRFPNSPYAADSTVRMKYLVNALAAHEIHVASYYLRRGAYVAALGRAQNVIKEFRQTPSLEAALQIMVQAYDGLGQPLLRDDARRVLQTTFPNSAGSSSATSSWWKFW